MKTYLVGGAVRDEILQRPVKDRDWVVVGATPEEMLANGFKQVGADFPVFLHPESGEEYALARVERKTGEGYHGFTVSTKDVTIEEDLSRRDLTINSIAKDGADGSYIDPFGGIADAQAKVLRHTGPAFAEDPLRVVRLARFAARYSDFRIADETFLLVQNMVVHGELDELPYERFWAELEKVVHEEHAFRFWHLMRSFGAFEFCKFFREVFGEQDMAFAETMFNNVKSLLPQNRLLTLAAVLPTGKRDLRVQGATAEMQKLRGYVLAMQGYHKTVKTQRQRIDAAFELVKMTKPWGTAPRNHENLERAAWLMEQNLNTKPFFYSFELESFKKATANITSEKFPHLTGVELGQAIEKARKQSLEMVL